MGQARSSANSPDHGDMTRWLAVLQHGDLRQQAQARARLAVIYERRGMIVEAIEMLETNLRLEAADDWHYARLLDLYRRQGAKASGHETEAAFSSPFAGAGLEDDQSPTSVQTAASAEEPPAIASAHLLAGGGIVGALGATLVFGIWQGDWRLQVGAGSIGLILLAGYWIARHVRPGTIARLQPGRLPAVGSLAIMALLVSVVWLDGQSQAVADVTVAVMDGVQAQPSLDAATPEVVPGVSPDLAERSVERSAGAAGPSVTRVDGLLLEAPTVPGRRITPPGDSPPRPLRRPDLVVVDADGGVWLRAAPVDGQQIKLLPNGARLVDLGERHDANGKRWRRVEDPHTGEGWIADAYVRHGGAARRAEAVRRELPATDHPIEPEVAGYLATLSPRLQSVDEELQALLSATTRAVERPSLLADTRWKAELISHVTTLQDRARQLQLVGAPAGLDEYSRTVTAAARDLTSATDELLNGIDRIDPGQIGAAVDRLDRVSEQLDRASSELYIALSRP